MFLSQCLLKQLPLTSCLGTERFKVKKKVRFKVKKKNVVHLIMDQWGLPWWRSG